MSIPSEVETVLGSPPGLDMGTPILGPRFVIDMTRAQAETLQRWLEGLLEAVGEDADRRLMCLQCISRIAIALRLSEAS
jgi:hypothetical protein